jgi:hypothetical protein
MTNSGSVLLSCAFLYDIFWVFISKRWFHESVMIVVARGDKTDEDLKGEWKTPLPSSPLHLNLHLR